MKKKLLLTAILTMCMLISTLAFSACYVENKLTLKDGSDLPAEFTAELGELFMLPEVVFGVTDATYVVKDTSGEETRVNNDKFRVTDLNGYVITFTAEGITQEVIIKVQDTTAPVIGLGVPDGMAVIKNTSFTIPSCTVTDASSNDLVAEVSVKDASGNDVTVINNSFNVTALGSYTIIYKAIDASGNEGVKQLIVNCENADLLNGFEDENSVGYISYNVIKEIVTENAATNNGIKLTVDDPANNAYRRICLPLKKNGEYISYEDLLEYEKVQIYVYISEDNEVGLANQTYPVKKGVNVIVFTRAQIEAAYTFSDAQYKENAEGFYLNLRYPTNGSYMILDNFIGIYARDYVPDAPPAYTIEINGVDGMIAIINQTFTIPTCLVKTAEGDTIDYSVTVTDANGNEVSITENAFTPTEIGQYTISYIVDYNGELATETITVYSKKGAMLNSFSSLEGFNAIGGFTAEKEIVEQPSIDGSSFKLTSTSTGSWVQVYHYFFDESKENQKMTWNDVKKFEKIQLYVYSNLAAEISLANGNPRISLHKGWNMVEFSINAIKASYDFAEATYVPATGFYFTFPSVSADNVFVFDNIIGVYADDYNVEEPEEFEPTMTVKGISGMTVVYGEENVLPECVVTNATGESVAYTVSVKDKDGNAVAVANNKFTASVLGAYTVTYSAEGFEDVTITLNSKKSKVLNTFNSASSMTYIGGWSGYATTVESENTLTNGGLTVVADTAACSWAQFYFYLKDGNDFMTWANLQKLEKLQIYAYASSTGGDFCHPAGSPRIAIKAGWNVIEISMADLVAVNDVAPYAENANGLQLMITSIPLGEYVIFDEVIGVYADNYNVEEPEEFEPTMTVKGISGMTVIYGEDNVLPECVVTDEAGEVVTYTVSVKDKDGNAVAVANNKFTASVLGAYTVTYSAEGFEDVTITLNSKKSKVINDFSATTGITYIGGWSGHTVSVENENTLTNGGLKVGSESANMSWGQIYVPFTDENGYITWANLKNFEKIQVVIYASTAMELTLANGAPRLALTEGWNVVAFMISDLIVANTTVPYAENANGLYLTIPSVETGEYVIFDEIIGVYANDYEEKVAISKVINAFSVITDITYIGGWSGHTVTIESVNTQTNGGLKVGSESADMSWGQIYVPLKDENGYITWVNLQKFERIEFTIYASTSMELTLGNGSPRLALKEGWNVVSFAISDLVAANSAVPYAENANGLYLTIPSVTAGEYVIFDEIMGVYPIDYVEEESTEIILNTFTVTSDITYIGGWAGHTITVESENTQTNGGLKVGSESANMSWGQIYVPLKDENGYISWENLQKFERVEITIYASTSMELTLGNGSPRLALKEGWNVVSFAISDLVAANSAVPYAENANGLYLTIPSIEAGEYVIFDQISGIYAE